MASDNRETSLPAVERRKYRRVRLITQVQCATLGREEQLVTWDISPGGMLIATQHPYPVDCEVDMSFALPLADRRISCRGRVSYAIEGCCMGVEFGRLSEESYQSLKTFVDEAK
jgi:c-di-GMP-binding flagellar brake protein YcgR